MNVGSRPLVEIPHNMEVVYETVVCEVTRPSVEQTLTNPPKTENVPNVSLTHTHTRMQTRQVPYVALLIKHTPKHAAWPTGVGHMPAW